MPAETSTQVSESIIRKSASNLALAFILLPKEKRSAMSALYAFCREVDDIADEEIVPVAARREQLAAWREDVRKACSGGKVRFPVIREMQPFIVAYRLRFELFDDLIRGVEMDLDIIRYRTFAELEQYCYRVASVVGLLSIEVFGYRDPVCRDYAVHLGKALQLTNILRDVHNDAARGRIYLPLDELAKLGVTESEIMEGRYTQRYFELARLVADRARSFYRAARERLPPTERKSMATAELMGSVYWRILKKLEKRKFDVFSHEPARLNKIHKALLILRTWTQMSVGLNSPGYGVC